MKLARISEGTKYLNVEIPWWVEELLRDKTEQRRIYVTKGLGAGGTFGLAIWHYLMTVINAKSHLSWCIAPTFQQVADTLIPTFAEVLQVVFQLDESVDFKIIRAGHPRIEFPATGQEIHFKSANRADTLVGANVSHISGTEPGLWDELVFQKPGDRLRHKNAKVRQWLMEGTPEGMGNGYEKRANFPDGVNKATNSRRVTLWTEDNPHLPEGYVPQLTRTYEHDSGKLESYLRGNFVPFTKGTAYWNFRHSINVKLDVKISEFLPLLWCWDFNKDPLAWVLVQLQPHEKRGYRYHRYVALAESDGKSRGILDGVAEFAAKVPPELYRDVPIEVYGDASGYAGSVLSPNCAYDQVLKYARNKFNRITVKAATNAPEIRDRLERTSQLMIYERYVVAAWCRNLIRGFEHTALKPGLWEIQKPKGEQITHWPEAVDYMLFQCTKGLDLEDPNSLTTYGFNL